MSLFDEFTNQYELTKTLRFELRPVEKTKTKEFLKRNQVFEKDELVAENYKKAKEYFDILHREFIDKALEEVIIPREKYKEYEKAFYNFKAKKIQLKKFESIRKKLRVQITNSFEDSGEKRINEYKQEGLFKKKGEIVDDSKIKKLISVSKTDVKGVLFGKESLKILKYKHKNVRGFQIVSKYLEDKIFNEKVEKNLFETFPGSAYFSKFQQSRANFYKNDGTASAIPTRIINDNLPSS